MPKRDAAAAAGDHEPHPAGAFDPIVRNRPASGRPARLKVVAFNAAGGGHLDAIAELLSRPPLAGASAIFLCEMDWRLTRSGNRELAAELADRLKMSFAFQPVLGFARPGAEAKSFSGSAILCVEPLGEVRPLPIPATYELTIGRFRGSPRNYRRIFAPVGLAAEIRLRGERVVLALAHLESHTDPGGRERQMRALLSGLPPDGRAILAGDLNTTTTLLGYRSAPLQVLRLMVVEPLRFRDPQHYEPLFQRLREAGFATAGANVPLKPTFTFTRLIPPLMRPKLDWIAARGLEPAAGSAAVVPVRLSIAARRISDHDAIVCDFLI